MHKGISLIGTHFYIKKKNGQEQSHIKNIIVTVPSSMMMTTIIIELGTVTASDMKMHHVNYIDLDIHSRSRIS